MWRRSTHSWVVDSQKSTQNKTVSYILSRCIGKLHLLWCVQLKEKVFVKWEPYMYRCHCFFDFANQHGLVGSIGTTSFLVICNLQTYERVLSSRVSILFE